MRTSRAERKLEMMSQLEQAVERVLDWQDDHPTFRLEELEGFVLQLRREFGATIAEAVIGQLDNRRQVKGPPCPARGGVMVNKGLKRKELETRVGEVSIEREYYHCPACAGGVFPPG
jgi:hypothetical protein